MKRKAMILSFSLFALLVFNMDVQPLKVFAAGEDVKIPEQSIRLRILANSNSAQDQETKRTVRDAVNKQIAGWVGDLETIQQARKAIRSHLPEIRTTVEEVLKQRKEKYGFSIKFGDVQFPTKLYGNYVYPAGIYEALLITLGSGKGANWWCVLFPPLCFLDFENGDAVKKQPEAEPQKPTAKSTAGERQNEIQVKFFVVEWFSSLIHAIAQWF
ncbi:MAG TPA: stage II sporulation protein R [Bacillales bacterium]|nr:stage II sporulation protein R [Bacillales bacterium]